VRLYDYDASGNCYKVRLLLAQLDRPYERVPVDIFAGDTLTDEFAARNPRRELPVLETDEGRHLPDSSAILWYLGDGTPFLPDDPFERAHVLGWLIFEQTEVIPGIGGLRFRLLTGRLEPDDPQARVRREHGLAALGVLEQHLRDHDFLVGARYGIADIAVYAYTHVGADAGFDLEEFPAVDAWLRRVESQPRFVDDLVPYWPNARPGAGSSIYG
jgi:glutathione S-transferase